MTTGTSGHKAKVLYPETDGKPLPDGEYQSPIFRDVVGTLETHFRDRPGVHVNGNTLFYYEEGNPRRVVSPDCYVVFAVNVEIIFHNNTYLLWEMGKPPDFVLEIGSSSTATYDMGGKRDLYASLGVDEYWRYDGTGGDFYRDPLVGEFLEDGEYRRFELNREPDGLLWSYSPALDLDLCWDNGRLRYYDPRARSYLLNRDEERAARQAAQAAVDSERAARQAAQAAVDSERAARQAAEGRVAQLEAELQRLRGESA